MKIDEFMATRDASIDTNNSVYDAREKMVDRRIRSLIIKFATKISDHDVITARDIVFKVLAKGTNLTDIKVSSIAATPIVCVDREVTLAEAAALMEKSLIARLFVYEGEKNYWGGTPCPPCRR